jgi:hypothetical protein
MPPEYRTNFPSPRIAILALSIPPSVSAIITSAYHWVITFSPTHRVIAITRNAKPCFFLQPATVKTAAPRSQGCTSHVLFGTKYGRSQQDCKGSTTLLSLTATRNQTVPEL